MPSPAEWSIPVAEQPRAENFAFDLDRTLTSMVGLHAMIPNEAFTADTLGTERSGNGVVIGDGLVLTVGYLVTEAETVWIHKGDGQVVAGHPLGFDQETGFGLVQALGSLNLPALSLGASRDARVGSSVVVGGVGGRSRSVAGHIAAKEPFSGYWEYALDEAIFTAPPHPNWGGAGLISAEGELLGIGSLQLERGGHGTTEHLNMIIPIDLLKPVLQDLKTFGRVNKPPRPWLGLYSTEVDDCVVVAGLAAKAPAARAQLKTGDMILAVNDEPVATLSEFYHKIWALGAAGVEVPLTLNSGGVTFDVRLKSADRARFLWTPKMH